MNLRTIAFAAAMIGAPAAFADDGGLMGAIRYLETQGWREIEIRRDDQRIGILAERGSGREGWVYHSGRLVPVEVRRSVEGGRRWIRLDDDDRWDDDDDDDDDRWGDD